MDDREIIEMYWKRDQKAIYYTSQKYEGYCYSIVYNILKNKEDSEESVNDTWLAVWNDIPPKRPNVFRMFLARITRNRAINVLKAKVAVKRRGGEGVLVLEELSECVSDGRDIAGELEAKELERAIGTFVAGLPEREGDIFIRRYFYVEKVKNIAFQYKFKGHNVTEILRRTRAKLKEYLIKEGFIDE